MACRCFVDNQFLGFMVYLLFTSQVLKSVLQELPHYPFPLNLDTNSKSLCAQAGYCEGSPNHRGKNKPAHSYFR